MQTYEGKENYIFVSYAHKDSDRVLPIIEALNDAGYRVWYDAGIEAGTEWPEYVAEHLCNSKVVLVFLSKNALNSQNCTREIHFAIAERKEILVVYLEDLKLTAGMRMQLGSLQAIFYDRFSSQREFLQALSSAKILNESKIVAPPKNNIPTAYNHALPVQPTAPLPSHPQNIPTEKTTTYKAFSFSRTEKHRSFLTGEEYSCCAVKFDTTSTEKNIIIPEKSPQRIPVGLIGECGFKRSTIKSVFIPQSVRQIGRAAFSLSSKLQSVTIDEGVEVIMTQAFSYCHSLKNVILPSTLCVMGDLVFRGCSSLEELDFPSPALNGALERIGAEVFRDCVSLRRVHLPKTLKKIEANAFAGCSALKNIELPDSVQQIELLAFCECTSLTSVFIPKNVEKIEVGAFKGCKNLKRIYCETKFAPSDWHESFQNCHPDLKIVWGVSREQAKKMENN